MQFSSNSLRHYANSSEIHTSQSTQFLWLSNFWNSLLHNLLRPNTPQIVKHRNRSGQTYYRAYDAASGSRAYCVDEQDVRAWLDKLPYC